MQEISLVQQPLSQSYILFQEVVADNEPTEEEVIDRAQELQIDDLSLARQSLTKELESHWRPYINRYGDVYYINLKQQRAYVDHPVDMVTKLLYAKRYKTRVPKFKSYQLSDVVGTMRLIQQETVKWKRSQFSFTRQSAPTQLNIVYEESDESQTERAMSENSQMSQSQQMEQLSQQDEEYIQNLQHTARLHKNNVRSKTIQQNDLPKVFNKEHKKFPTLEVESSDDQFEHQSIPKHLQQQHQNSPLPPQYERLLLQYEEQLIKQNDQSLKRYKQQKEENFNKKQHIIGNSIKRKQETYKLNVFRDFERQTEEKNRIKFEKDSLKVKKQFTQKIHLYEQKLKREHEIMQKLSQNLQQKQSFVQSLQQRLESRLLKEKFIKSQSLNKQFYENMYIPSIKEISSKQQQKFGVAIHKVLSQKISQKLRSKGVYDDDLNQVVYPESFGAMYEQMVKKELKTIDTLLLENEVSKQTRKRRKSFFTISKHSSKQIQQSEEPNKQNDGNKINILEEKVSIVSQIERDIMKCCENRIAFRQRRNKIFCISKPKIQSQDLHKVNTQLTQTNQYRSSEKEIKKQLGQKQNYFTKININMQKSDRKSMYLRMTRRIL